MVIKIKPAQCAGFFLSICKGTIACDQKLHPDALFRRFLFYPKPCKYSVPSLTIPHHSSQNTPTVYKDSGSYMCEFKAAELRCAQVNIMAQTGNMKKVISYIRVSTAKQGQSGLGLEAQRLAVNEFISVQGFVLEKEYVEVESGKKNHRPVLLEALADCKKSGATLLIAKLDRLGRSVAFISKLMEARVDFKAVDNPYAEKFMVHLLAAYAEHERDLISKRTKAAMQIAKARGVKLGEYGRNVLSKQNKEKADAFARKMKPILEKLRKRRKTTLREITNELNRLKLPTATGESKKWHINTVFRLIKRINEVQ